MERFENTRQPDWDWWGKLWPTPGETLRQLGLSSGDSFVEIGCGNGYFALPAARIVEPAPVYAVDIEESLLSELEALSAHQGIENIVPICGDVRSLTDLLPEAVDVALIANTFHGVDDPGALTREVVAALADDGRFVVINWRPLPRETTTVDGEPRGPPTERRLSVTACRELIEDASDTTLTEWVDIEPYHYALVFEK